MRRRIEAVDWLRGIAALWVLSYHANLILQSPKYFDGPSLGHWAEIGYRGVELFFVISGFVMAATVPTDARNDWQGMRGYASRRLFRIFPAYIAVFVPLALVGLLTGLAAPNTGTIESNLIPNVLLLPRDDVTTYIPVVAWTLTHELMFYAIFATAYIRRSLAILLLILWAGGCMAFDVIGAVPSGWQMQLSVLNLYFLVGVAAARLKVTPVPLLAVVICAAGATGWAILLDDPIVKVDLGKRTALYMIGFGALVVLATRLSPATAKAWHAPLRLLGRQSYSIYLVHYPIIVAVAMTLKGFDVGESLLLPMIAILTLGVSWSVHLLVEEPGIRLGERIGSRTNRMSDRTHDVAVSP